MWHFFLVHIPMSSYTTRSGWRWSVFELRMGRKVRNCRFLTICVQVSLSTYLSITRPSCNMSDRFDLIFGLLVGRWHPHSVTLNIWPLDERGEARHSKEVSHGVQRAYLTCSRITCHVRQQGQRALAMWKLVSLRWHLTATRERFTERCNG